MYHRLDFKPLPGFSSPHLQMFFSSFAPPGKEPPTKLLFVNTDDKDFLCCKVSTPPQWEPHHHTIALVHGLGGSDASSYMVRLTRKFYRLGIRVVRINFRGCGAGVGLNNLPYTCGDSHDVRAVLERLKSETPQSKITLIGFSLGGNVIIKLAGELEDRASSLIHRMIALCPVIDLTLSVGHLVTHKSNRLYHRFYLRCIKKQGKKWIQDKSISSIHEYDEKVTVPLLGYLNLQDYYERCSSSKVISKVQIPLDIIMAEDDPFLDPKILYDFKLSSTTKAWLATGGGHGGFIGRSEEKEGIFWADNLLVKWIKDYLSIDSNTANKA